MVSTKAIELIVSTIEARGESYDKIAAASTVSKSTISRLMKQHAASRYTLDMLAAYLELGDQYAALVGSDEHSCAFASEMAAELKSVREYYEQKGASLREHYEEQLASMREQMQRQETERTRERETQEKTYERSVAYLKQQVEEMRKERSELRADLDEANKKIASLDSKRHNVFWGMLIAIILILLLFGAAIIADIPQIGMGW